MVTKQLPENKSSAEKARHVKELQLSSMPMETLPQELVSNWNEIKAFFWFDTSKLSDPGIVFRLVLQGFLLFCSAFFSSSETALFSLSRLDLQQLRRERNPHSETIHALLDQPRRLIISILSGNELVNIAAAANMTAILVTLYGSNQAGWINLMVMIPLLLLFGEVTPKTIAVSNPVRYSTAVIASPMNIWVKIITPVYPVPVASDLNIILNIDYDSKVNAQIFDMTGRLVWTSEVSNVQAGQNQLYYPMDDRIADGNYLLKLVTDKEAIVQMIISKK